MIFSSDSRKSVVLLFGFVFILTLLNVMSVAPIAILGVAGAVISGSSVLNLSVDMGQVNRVIDNGLATQERSTIFLVLFGIAILMQLSRSGLTYLTTGLSVQLDYVVKQEI